ncbi:adenylate/guanylate cyclase domain-containing protein [Acuticoccus sediminis]|uniref:adenylate/guanylate cyclase domain-containing protein n=1 Tax=Acuticoccus sediminis TaxID=2184697 RepID=UPI001CFCA91C|nr:adenylate/guanylate cyclase domain-containing protein [Acuticoccus sediminis]
MTADDVSSMASGEDDPLIFQRILQSMRDGVISIDLEGQIITFNDAAGHILGKDPAEVLGQSFAEVFLLEEAYDAFNEVVFKAVYESELTHSVEVILERGDATLDLVVSSSLLTRAEPDGERKRLGVVVVVSDITEQRKRRKIKQLFGAYVDPRIVERILSESETERSRRGDMTISFVDMRDYTGWSERLPPATLVDLLNRFLAAVTQPVAASGGITDKYIGDSAMAVWGPPFTDPETQARDACSAALGQIAALGPLREALAAEGLTDANRLDAVVGVATGDVLSGDIGPVASRNYTVIGNAVNLAARLQEAAKVYGQPILLTAETATLAGPEMITREIDLLTVRGSERPVIVHALLGRAGEVPEETIAFAARYRDAIVAMRLRDWDTAEAGLLQCLEEQHYDVPSRLMLDRVAVYRTDPPGEDWDGVWRGTTPRAAR